MKLAQAKNPLPLGMGSVSVRFGNQIYVVNNDFTSDDTASTTTESLAIDIALGNLQLVSAGAESPVNEYGQGIDFQEGFLVVHNDKLYLVVRNFTSDDSATTIAESLEIDVSLGNLELISGGGATIVIYESGQEYTEGQLIVYNGKLFIVKNDFTSTTIEQDIENGDIVPLSVDLSEYMRTEDYVGNSAPYSVNRADTVTDSGVGENAKKFRYVTRTEWDALYDLDELDDDTYYFVDDNSGDVIVNPINWNDIIGRPNSTALEIDNAVELLENATINIQTQIDELNEKLAIIDAGLWG